MSTKQQLLTEVAHRHAAAEAAADIEGTMNTLEGEPVYELYPVGLQLRGMARVRRYYEYFFAQTLPNTLGYELRNAWVNDIGLLEEYDIDCGIDGSKQTFRVLSILKFGEQALSGERLYADEKFFRFLFGPLWSELEPL
ncbi:MAG TPA: hypothetical protein VLC91_05185 [Spongiibacteraceae bacterium]|nr:hypothetical protein [Spongiibacteraceae bacterium]